MRKGQYISEGGRLTMVKSMLGSLPIYFLSTSNIVESLFKAEENSK